MLALQLDLFEQNDSESLIMRELQQIQSSLDRRTRAQFRMISDLSKLILELKEENIELKRKYLSLAKSH